MIDVGTIGTLGRPVIVAHRGASRAAHENTIEAFKIATAEGADILELDVRMTGDGVLIVHHDDSVSGLGTRLSELTYDESTRQAESAGYELPTLEEVLARFASRIALDIELKEANLERGVASLVRRLAPISSILLKSFDSTVVRQLSQVAPEIMRGLVVDRTPGKPYEGLSESTAPTLCEECGAQFLAAHWQLIGPQFTMAMHEAGLPVLTWTVDDVATARRLVTDGVDGIITNLPGVMVEELL